MTYRKLLNTGKKEAKKLGLEETAIKLLVLELSGFDGANFLLHLDDELSPEKINQILQAFDEYYHGKPVQHIIGYSYFYGYKMIVNSNVLIPRPETEELVGYILSYYDDYFGGTKVDVVDIGTGSGNIAIALALEEANMNVSASDISIDALGVAKTNALNNNAKVKFYQGNMLDPFIQSNQLFDILVSNPPYIPDDEYVEPLVLDNEPNVALFGGDRGMKFYEEIFKNAKKILKPKAMMAFEHSHKTKNEMMLLANKYFPDASAICLKDLNGKDRMTFVFIGGDVSGIC